jgi:RimJ/RimL family protein N-acetyltransferase
MSEETYISFACPKCGNSVEYLDQYAGSAQPCPYCGEDIIVPRSGDQEGFVLPLPIETPRLLLRRLQMTDFSDTLEILSDNEIFHYDERPPMEEDEVKGWLEQVVKEKLSDPRGELTLGLDLKGVQKLVGLLSFRYRDRNRQQATLSITIASGHQRQGFGFEALRAALSFSFCDIGLHRVVATCDSRNTAGVGLFTKVGMRKEGESLRDRYVDEEWADSAWFAMLSEEFPQG